MCIRAWDVLKPLIRAQDVLNMNVFVSYSAKKSVIATRLTV